MRPELKEWVNSEMMGRYRSWPKFKSLEFVKHVGGYKYYKCPFGCKDYAYINVHFADNDFHPVIYCPHCDKHGWFMVGQYVYGVLEAEERLFRKSLDKFKDCTAMPASEACKKWHSEGLPLEIAEDLAIDPDEFRRLVSEHRATGSSGATFTNVYE